MAPLEGSSRPIRGRTARCPKGCSGLTWIRACATSLCLANQGGFRGPRGMAQYDSDDLNRAVKRPMGPWGPGAGLRPAAGRGPRSGACLRRTKGELGRRGAGLIMFVILIRKFEVWYFLNSGTRTPLLPPCRHLGKCLNSKTVANFHLNLSNSECQGELAQRKIVSFVKLFTVGTRVRIPLPAKGRHEFFVQRIIAL